MLNAFPTARPLGFSLVELMIGIAIIGFALVVGIPGYKTWIQNTQIRNAAESIQNGMQRARAEAVGRNTNVAFVLGVAGNSSWAVNVVNPAAVIESRANNEGSTNATSIGLAADLVTVASTITFNNFGAVAVNADGTPALVRVDIGSSRPGQFRDLRITVGVGGNVRMCDPNMPVSVPPSPLAC